MEEGELWGKLVIGEELGKGVVVGKELNKSCDVIKGELSLVCLCVCL